jgi:hypothetical protein
MANTVIQIKYSTVTGNTPTSLANGELAINTTDGRLFYSNTTGAIKYLQSFTGPSGLNKEIQFNDGGVLGANASLTFDKATGTLSAGRLTLSNPLVVSSGGTGLSTISANAVILGNGTGNVLTVAPGTAGNVLTSEGGTWVSKAASSTSGATSYLIKTSAYTAVNGDKIVADTSGGSFTINLPATPTTGHSVVIVDGANWGTNNLIIGRNGSTIEGLAENLTVDIGTLRMEFVYDGSTWEIFPSITSPSTEVIKATNDTTTSALYPVMVSAAGGQAAKVTTTTNKLEFDATTGSLTTTNFNTLSDARKKENIETITNSLEKVLSLRGVSYTLKDTGQESIGVIAQEIEKIIPEVVQTNENGEKTVSYGNIIGLLIEAIKELKKEIDKK